MYNLFFDSLETGKWAPPVFPDLRDEEWNVRFTAGAEQVKRNIANSWLWQYNQLLKSVTASDKTGKIGVIIGESLDYNRVWISQIKPFINEEYFAGSMFDGSVTSYIKHLGKPAEQDQLDDPEYLDYWCADDISHPKMAVFAQALEDLWFGQPSEKSKALGTIAEMFDKQRADGGTPPLIGHLVENLAWDGITVSSSTLDRMHAARLSIHSAWERNYVPEHDSDENRAWHGLAYLNFAKAHPTNVFGNNAFEILRASCPITAAANLPYIMKRLRSDDNDRLFHTKTGVLKVIDKPRHEITGYEVLKAWIPAKNDYWDMAESLDIDYEQACLNVVRDGLATQRIEVSLPNAIIDNNTTF